jgi:cytochrome c5
MEQWGRSCAFCHASGNAGAPRLNDVAAWRERVAAGEDQLLRHTLEGLNAMPPLGYCMDCTEADFRALIRFMIPAELKTEETGA